MSEFFLELFSDEIPPKLQIDAKNTIIQILESFTKREKLKMSLLEEFMF